MANSPWIWNRSLDPQQDCECFVSRAQDVKKLLALLAPGVKGVFVWSPPKCGSTTFFRELKLVAAATGPQVHVLDAREIGDGLPAVMGTLAPSAILVLDELDELAGSGDVKSVLERLQQAADKPVAWVLAGDARAWDIIRELSAFDGLQDFELSSPTTEQVAKPLVLAPLNRLGLQLTDDAARELVSEAAGNLYLVQYLSNAFWTSMGSRTRTQYGLTEMRGFLADAGEQAKSYFDTLADRVLRDETARYTILDLAPGHLRSPSIPLRRLGVVNPGGTVFASVLFGEALRERCTPLKFARRLARTGEWVQAIEFYELELSQWAGSAPGLEVILDEAVRCSYLGRDCAKYLLFARRQSHLLDASVRANWLEKTFLPQLVDLLRQLRDTDDRRIIDTVLGAVDVIARTGRGRVYLSDAKEERLVCRAAIGPFADEFAREPIVIDKGDWLAASVYRTRRIEDVPEVQPGHTSNRKVAQACQLHSSWLFPIVATELPDTTSEHVFGVCCVDNPYHSADRPGEAEKSLVVELLRRSAEALWRARKEAVRNDLQFRVERLTSLSRYLLTTRDAREIVQELFAVAKDIQPNLSMIIVRSVAGHRRNRLEVAGFWPKDLERVLMRPDLNRISIADHYRDPRDAEFGRFVYDVHDPEDHDKSVALDRFLRTLEEERIPLPVGSLLSFRLEWGAHYLGTCNFYTNVPYEFLDDEKSALGMIVEQTAVTLSNKRQIEDVERQRKALEILNDCIGLVNRGAAPRDLERVITRRFGELFNVHSASFVSVDHAARRLLVECTWPAKDVVGGGETQELAWGEGVTGWAVEDRETRVLSEQDFEWSKRFIGSVARIRCCAAIPMKDASGSPIGVLVLESQDEDKFTPEDIQLIEAVVSQVPIAVINARLMSDLREAYDELRRKHEELERRRWTEVMGESVAAAVHRIGNIGCGVDTFAKKCAALLEMTPLPKEEIVLHLSQIVQSGERMAQIAKRLAGSGKRPTSMAREDLCDCVSTVANAMKWNAVEFELQRPVDGCHIVTDRERLIEIMECLLENAVQASRLAADAEQARKPRVTVTIRKTQEATALIDVTDSGRGVPPYVRKDFGRTLVQSNWGGHGIGLFVSTRHAIALGGTLELAENASTGATFRLTLPLNAPVTGRQG